MSYMCTYAIHAHYNSMSKRNTNYAATENVHLHIDIGRYSGHLEAPTNMQEKAVCTAVLW